MEHGRRLQLRRAKELFEGPLKGKHINIFKGLANSPAALEAYLNMSAALRGGLLTEGERELIALVVAEANRCDYCVAAHRALGKLARLTEEQMLGARRGNVPDAKLNALTRFVRTLHEKRGGVDDRDLQAVRSAGYGDGHIAEIVASYALNVYTNYFNHVNATEVDFPRPPAVA